MPADQLVLPRNRRAVPTRTRLATRRVPAGLHIAVLLLLPVLVVGGAMASGWWSTAGHGGVSLSAGGQEGGEGSGTGPADGEVAAPASPADVKGSMTVRQVVDAFPPVTAAEVLAAFGVGPDTADSAQLKTLVKEGEGTDLPAFRTWLEGRLSRG